MTAQQQEQPDDWATPITFRLTTYRKLRQGEHGITSWSTKRVAASEALEVILGQLPEDALQIDLNSDANGDVTTVRIDWSKVPGEIRYPFSHGVKRR